MGKGKYREGFMADTVSDFMIDRLHEWGIRRIYGYPGDGINGIMGALGRNQDKLQFVQVRHEEEAAFMATAHAKYSGGELGVCLATSGPGAIHLLNGLYDARKDHMPVLAIVGQQARTALGADYQQEVDLVSLFKDVARDYVQEATTPPQMRHLIDEGVRIALGKRTVTCIIVPHDLQDLPMEEPPRKHGSTFSGVGFSYPRVVPAQEDLRRAAEVLNSGKKVGILVGAGIKDAVDEIVEVAEILGGGIAKALLAKTMVPDDIPFVTGSIGLLGTEATDKMMRNCDTLFMVGSSFPYSEWLPEEGQARGVQIDLDSRALGLRYPMEVNLQGDSKETLRALIPHLKRKSDRSWQRRIEGWVDDWWKVSEARAMMDADPINPQRVFWELSQRLPDNCLISADSGSTTNWYARDIQARRGMIGTLAGGMATMCPAIPYITAAKFVHPERPAVAIVGDGAMQMLGNAGLITIAKYWKLWSNPQLVVVVANNRDLNQVTWEQRVMEGDPKVSISQDIPDFQFDKYAEMLGLIGLRMDKPEDVGPVLEEAWRWDRPVVINAYTDPNVPPLPPHITVDQAKKYMTTLIKGDPEAAGIVKQSAKGMFAKYFQRV
jgi:pyruvate dehydrogenase (quinone)